MKEIKRQRKKDRKSGNDLQDDSLWVAENCIMQILLTFPDKMSVINFPPGKK